MTTSKTWIDLTINSGAITYTGSNYCYCVVLKNITTNTFWSNIIDSSSISVYDRDTGLQRPKYVANLSIADKNGFIFFDAPVNTTKKIRIYFGKSLSVINSTSAFVNDNYGNYWTMSELTGSTIYDLCGSCNLDVNGATINSAGTLFKSVSFNGVSGNLRNLACDPLGTNDNTIGLITTVIGLGGSSVGRFWACDNHDINVRTLGRISFNNFSAGISSNSNNNLYTLSDVLNFDFTLKNNGDNVYYKNGSAFNSGANVGVVVPGTKFYVGSKNDGSLTFNGKIEHLTISKTIRSATYLATRHNMLINNSTFFTGYNTVYKKSLGGKLSLSLNLSMM